MFRIPTERMERFGVASCALSATGTSGAWVWESARARRWLDRKGAGRSAKLGRQSGATRRSEGCAYTHRSTRH